MDNILRTYHTSPQVVVYVNNQPAQCSNGVSCDFSWSESLNPIVNTIDTSSRASIIITGSGFSNDSKNNLVKIGRTPCSVTASSPTQIACTPGNGPVGVYNFTLNVLGKGWATMLSSATFEYALIVSSFSTSKSNSNSNRKRRSLGSANTGGTGGGTQLNILGEGFSDNTRVTLDGNDCAIQASNYSSIQCLTPPNVIFKYISFILK